MKRTETKLEINGVPFDNIAFKWKLYRGTEARPMVLNVGSKRWDEFRSVLNYRNNIIKIQCTDNPGTNAGVHGITIKNILCQRGFKVDNKLSKINLYDQRYDLKSYISNFDFNVKFGKSYLKGSSERSNKPATLEFALNKLITSTLNVGFIADSDVNLKSILPDSLFLSGQKLNHAIGQVLELLDYDLTIDYEGRFWIVSRSNVTDTFIPPQSSYSWLALPGFYEPTRYTPSAPKVIRAFYNKRYEMAMRNLDSKKTTTISKIKSYNLEQVFFWQGKILNLKEVSEEFSRATSAFKPKHPAEGLTNNYIQKFFTNPDFGYSSSQFCTQRKTHNPRDFDTNLEFKEAEEAEILRVQIAKSLVAVVRRDWRRFFRLKLPNNYEGMWSDLTLGKINEDGTVNNIDQAVLCNWVDFSPTPTLVNERITPNVSQLSQNNKFGLAPFKVEFDKDRLLIKLVSTGSQEDFEFQMPGELVENQVISIGSEKLKTIENNLSFQNSLLYSTYSNAKFSDNFDLEILMVGTLRHPNSSERWFDLTHKTEIEGAEREFLELPVASGLTANFTQESKTSPTNLADLESDLLRRAAKITSFYKLKREGSGTALGLKLFKDIAKPNGPIDQLTLEFGTHGPMYVGSTITVQNLAQKSIKENKAQRNKIRESQREHRGKKASN